MSFLEKCWRKIFFNLFKIVKATGKNIFFKFHSIQKLLAFIEEIFLFLDNGDNASRTCCCVNFINIKRNNFLIFGDFLLLWINKI